MLIADYKTLVVRFQMANPGIRKPARVIYIWQHCLRTKLYVGSPVFNLARLSYIINDQLQSMKIKLNDYDIVLCLDKSWRERERERERKRERGRQTDR